MIMVDIYIPEIGQVYDFEMDEEKTVGTVQKEIMELIAEKEKLPEPKETGMALYALQNAEILSNHRTLKEQGIQSGDKLILF